MLHPNGQSAGLAFMNSASCYNTMHPENPDDCPATKYCSIKEMATCSGNNSSFSRVNTYKSVSEEHSFSIHPRQPPTPSHLTSGHGFPITSGCVRLPCNPPCHFRSNLEMRLVRPVGGGFTSHGRGLSEY
ncbi:unnamed protein product [Heterobilharzia americana]|nr:unnamed protein product [Heterobilharzia americana]